MSDAPTEIARLTAEIAAERHLLNGLDDAIGVMYATRKTAVNRMFDTQARLASLKHYTAGRRGAVVSDPKATAIQFRLTPAVTEWSFGSLFSGVGGLDLGLERAGMTVAWQSEINPYACRVLAKHWPDVPNLGDITKIDWSTVPRVDLICGGFPCQDISSGGRKEGIGGARSGLWSFYADAIRTLRPQVVLVENVADLLVRGMGRVLGDLAEMGYDAEWGCIRASDIGAPIGGRGRDRTFIVAQPHGVGLEEPWLPRDAQGQLVAGATRGRGDVAGLPGAASDWWATEPVVGRVAHGVPARMDRLRALGNAVVPQVAEHIGRHLVACAERPLASAVNGSSGGPA